VGWVVSVYRVVLVLVLVPAVVGFSAGCGWLGGFAGAKQLTLGYIEWDENVAVSNLTKVVL
jgi:ABC-type proline/glycine betaine transport system substrate-binding protein